MIMADSSRIFSNNHNLNEQNSFTHLLESINPESEEEVNPTNHSAYFSNNECSGVLTQNNSNLSILNLNCRSVNANLEKLQIFLRCINNDLNPIHVITLHKSWGTANVEMKLFNLPDYAMLYDDSRLSKHGGLITYVHDSFAVDRLDIEEYYQKSTVFESMILKIHKKSSFHKKYIIGNIYRRPSDSIDELSLFIQEFALLLSELQTNPHKAYICGD